MIVDEFENNAKNGWHRIYQSIKEKADGDAKEKKFTTSEARSLTNRKLNRYGDVNPYDHSRIVLKRGDVDYINASLVQMDRAERKYILCQGPLPGTVGHFWLMVWEQNSKAILMLNKLIEKKQIKCHLYWPEKIGAQHRLVLEDVGLSVEYLKCEEYQNYSRRTFKLTDTENNESREIIQFHYTTWPDFGIPSSPCAFLIFLKKVRDSGALDPDVGPPIVHCSAGIGRSGTFCLVDSCLVLVDKEGESNVSVQSVLLELRKYRMGLIQTVDQLYFSYQAILDGVKRINEGTFDDITDEELVIENNKHNNESDVDEEITPPLPPPRMNSLNHKNGNHHPSSRPLPSIPQSTNDDDDETNSEKERLNNMINNEKTIESNNMNRPLPPLPSLAKLDERETLSDDDGDDDSDSDDDEEEIEENYSDEDQLEKSDGEKFDTTSSPTSPLSMNGDVITPVSSPDSDRSRNSEIRQRKRAENQKALADKVREIKRKQRETEDKCSKQSKKRRSLIISIAAGAFIGALCIYLYAKFN